MRPISIASCTTSAFSDSRFAFIERRRSRGDSQLPHPDQHGADFVEGALRRLDEIDRLLGVLVALNHAADFGAHAFRNTQPGSVIRRPVDFETRRQPLKPHRQVSVVDLPNPLNIDGGDVGVDSLWH